MQHNSEQKQVFWKQLKIIFDNLTSRQQKNILVVAKKNNLNLFD
jgi:hypothetical protein